MDTINRRTFLGYLNALAATTMLSPLLSCNTSDAPEKKPNIICIVADELSPEYLGCYGGKIPTPNIDALANSGVKFLNAYANAPFSAPNSYSLLTGYYPEKNNLPEYLKNNPPSKPLNLIDTMQINRSIDSLACLLTENGYYTGMVGLWHLGTFDPADIPTFAPYDDPKDNDVEKKLRHYQKILQARVKRDAGFDFAQSIIWKSCNDFPIRALQKLNMPWLTQSVTDFLDHQSDVKKPFLLFDSLPSMFNSPNNNTLLEDYTITQGGKTDIMQTWVPARNERNRILNLASAEEKHIYDGIFELDFHVGCIMEKIREYDLEDNTIIIITANQGVMPGLQTCYQKGVHIPLIMNCGDNVMPKSVSQLVQSVDILPTLLECTETISKINFDGISFADVFGEDILKSRQYAFFGAGYTRAVTDGIYKYIAFRPPLPIIEKMINGEMEYVPNYMLQKPLAGTHTIYGYYPNYFEQNQFYNIANDPDEQYNLYNDPVYANELDRLRGVLEEHLSNIPHPFTLDEIEYMNTEAYKYLVANTLLSIEA